MAYSLLAQLLMLCFFPILQEIQLLKRISHDRNIVQFYGACLETKPPMLIMEYMGVRAALMCIELGIGFRIDCPCWDEAAHAHHGMHGDAHA